MVCCFAEAKDMIKGAEERGKPILEANKNAHIVSISVAEASEISLQQQNGSTYMKENDR